MLASDVVDLGPCCACRASGPSVRNVLMLPYRAPVAGHGWGCFVCSLPADGAVAVVCDPCLEANRPRVDACRGYPAENGRVPIAELTEPFDHTLPPERH